MPQEIRQNYELLSALAQHARKIPTSSSTVIYKTRRYRDEEGRFVTLFWPIGYTRSCIGFRTYCQESFFTHSPESIRNDLNAREVFQCQKGYVTRRLNEGAWRAYNPWLDPHVLHQWENVSRHRKFCTLEAHERIKGRKVILITGPCAVGKTTTAIRQTADGSDILGTYGSSRLPRLGETSTAWENNGQGEIFILDKARNSSGLNKDMKEFYKSLFDLRNTICNLVLPPTRHYYFVLEKPFREGLSKLDGKRNMLIPCGLDLAELLTGALTQPGTPTGKPTTICFLPGHLPLVKEWYLNRATDLETRLQKLHYDLELSELMLKITDYIAVLANGSSRQQFQSAFQAIPKK